MIAGRGIVPDCFNNLVPRSAVFAQAVFSGKGVKVVENLATSCIHSGPVRLWFE